MLNKVFLVGRLVRDPEMRMTMSGVPVTQFTMAVDRIGRDQPTDFIRVVAWRKLGEICNQYLNKGKLVHVEGRLQFSYYTKDGQERSIAEVIADTMQMLDRQSQVSESSASMASGGEPV